MHLIHSIGRLRKLKPRAAGSLLAGAFLTIAIIALTPFPGPSSGAAAPSGATAPPKHKRLPARISRVFDGYSFQVGNGLRSALIGVTAPAKSARGGKESFAFLKKLLEGNEVQLEVDKKLVDTYGQVRYYVYLDDGTLVNKIVLLRGYARAVIKHPNVRHRKELLNAEKLAKKFKRGIWGDEFTDPKKADGFEKSPFKRNPPFPSRRKKY
jgi:micrococcal nuclease